MQLASEAYSNWTRRHSAQAPWRGRTALPEPGHRWGSWSLLPSNPIPRLLSPATAQRRRGLAARLELKAARGSLSQETVADEIGISIQQYSNIERGINWPSMPVCLEICRVLKLRMPALMK